MEARVLVAADMRPENDHTFRVADEVATALGHRLSVIHVVTAERLEELIADQPAERKFVDIVLRQLHDELTQKVNQILHAQGTAEVRVKEGSPGQVLVALAEEGSVEFLVIGVRNRSRVGKLIFGSTAQEVLLGARCPVIAVPTH